MADLDKICRICLETHSEELHQIFDNALNNKIIIITGLDIVQTDAYPKNICTNCRYQLEKSYYLRMLAKQSDVRLRKFLRLKNQKKEAGHVLEKDYKDDDIEEFEEQLVETHSYLDDISQQIEEGKRKAILDELTKLKSKFESPRKLHHMTSQLKSTSSKPVVVLNKFSQNASPAIRRKRKIDEIKSATPIEISELKMVEDSQYEIRILQTDAEGGSAEVAVLEFESAPNTENFKIINEPVEEFHEIIEEVPEPKKSASPKKSAQSIQQSDAKGCQDPATEYYYRVIDDSESAELDENNEKKIFQCAYGDCTVTFSRRQQCKTHYYNHLAVDSNFCCKFCSKKFKVQSALERHERVHNNLKPFICETCKKGFSQKEMLKRHIMIHLPIEEAKFACKICDKRFRQKDPLRKHMLKAHTDQDAPKYQCNLCDKSFAHSSGLSRHLLIHSGKIFSCEECQRQFTDKSALKRHASVHANT